MIHGLLPIGSVVLIGNSEKKVMIIGVCQRSAKERERIWDYSGVIYPEGFLDPQKMFLFDNEQITQIFALGYQDAEQLAFKQKADLAISKLKNKTAEEQV